MPDGGFGDGGRVTLDDVAPYLQVQRVRAQPDGKVVVAAWCQASRSAGARACVVRLNSNGSRDATFGVGGVRDIAAPAGNAYYLYDLRIGGDGKIYAAGTQFFSSPPRAIVMRLLPDGTLDAGYGTGGIAALAFTGESAYAFSVHPLADGRQIVFGFNLVSNSSSRAYLARLTAGGQPDSAFGDGGIGALPSTPLHSFNAGVVLADGNLLAIGQRYNTPGTSTDIDTILARFVGVEIAGTVVEFYNTGLNHYFVTADPNEAAAIDNGAAGPGWGRTGLTFKSGGPNRVPLLPLAPPRTGGRLAARTEFALLHHRDRRVRCREAGHRLALRKLRFQRLAGGCGWVSGGDGCGQARVQRAVRA
ncbi:MAG: hypothetical protein IPO58_13990 [Betaproteobacteria bacterium]|nr:hypothetical protein [Betaproteobacteria bacterium]